MHRCEPIAAVCFGCTLLLLSGCGLVGEDRETTCSFETSLTGGVERNLDVDRGSACTTSSDGVSRIPLESGDGAVTVAIEFESAPDPGDTGEVASGTQVQQVGEDGAEKKWQTPTEGCTTTLETNERWSDDSGDWVRLEGSHTCSKDAFPFRDNPEATPVSVGETTFRVDIGR